jgi:hypothetical protein
MKTFTAAELLSIAYTAEKLRDIATTLAARDSKEYRDACALSDIAYRMRQAAVAMEHDPEAAELLMMSLIRPLQTA